MLANVYKICCYDKVFVGFISENVKNVGKKIEATTSRYMYKKLKEKESFIMFFSEANVNEYEFSSVKKTTN